MSGPISAPSLRLLRSRHELDQARTLLARVYCTELAWRPRRGNPSGQRIVVRDGVARLEDRFDDTATWVGAFVGDTLVACARVGAGDPGRCELELYRPQVPRPAGWRCVEINRLAIAPEVRAGPARLAVRLLARLHDVAVELGADLGVCTTPLPSLARTLERFGFQRLRSARFRYDRNDPVEVQVLILGRDGFAAFAAACARRLCGRPQRVTRSGPAARCRSRRA